MSVEKWLRNGYLLKALLNVPFYEIKSCGVVPSFYINIRQNEEFCSLKHRIKKGIFFVVAKMNLFGSGKVGGGGGLINASLIN